MMPAVCRIATLIFVQMLPATLVAPAIRPLFAMHHGGVEGAMHAFMAVNMAGAFLAAPLIGLRADRGGVGARALALLCLTDGLLFFAFAAGGATGSILALRFLEGAAHVGASTLLLARAAGLARSTGRPGIMGLAGGALMMAIAAGNGLGGLLVGVDPRLPFVVAGAIGCAVAVAVAAGAADVQAPVALAPQVSPWRVLRRRASLRIPVAAAFVARFTVGALVVTFALFAHRAHGLSDRHIGGLFALLTFPFALGTYPLGRLADRVSPGALLAVGGVVYAAALLALGEVAAPVLPIVMVTAGLASAAIFAPILTYGARLGGEGGRATAMALINAAGCLGMLLGPAAAGIVSHLYGAVDPVAGYRVVFRMAALSVVVWLAVGAPWLLVRVRTELADSGALSRLTGR
jgi:MFS family permease